jgi:AbrB family looped-hinge helix DNA binding protein
MTKPDNQCNMCPKFLGTATMGEKGQIVIPKEVRDIYDLKKGDQLVVVVGPQDAIALIPMNKAKALLEAMTKQLGAIINIK